MKHSVKYTRSMIFFWALGILSVNLCNITAHFKTVAKSDGAIQLLRFWIKFDTKSKFSLVIFPGISVQWAVSLAWIKSISFLNTFFFYERKNKFVFRATFVLLIAKILGHCLLFRIVCCLPASQVFSSAQITDLLLSGIFRFLTILENNYHKPLQLFIALNYLIINSCQFFHLKWHYL